MNAPKRELKPVTALAVLLIASAALLIGWGLAVPVFEAPDELAHWQYAAYLRQYKRLPIYGRAFVEANSPPLYYLFIAPVAVDSLLPPLASQPATAEPRRTSETDFDQYSWGAYEQLISGGQAAIFQHSPGEFSRYWAIYSARLLTVLFSVATVLFIYLAGREATGRPETGLLAGALAALLPQFTFRGMNVSNDALVTALSAATIYCLVRLVRRGFTVRLGLAGATLAALALLTKPTSLFLIGVLALAIVSEPAPWPLRLKRLAVLGVTPLLAAPWLIRNLLLYGDVLAHEQMYTAVAPLVDAKSLTDPYFVTKFPAMLAQSFVGVFGWMNLGLPSRLYVLFAGLAGLAVLGHLWRSPKPEGQRRLALLLLSAVGFSLAVVTYINLTFTQPQGRYLFPALSAIAVLVALGLEGLPRWSPRLAGLTIGALALVNVYALFVIVLPTYWRLPALEGWVMRLHQVPNLYTSAAVTLILAAMALLYLDGRTARRGQAAEALLLREQA